MLLSPYHRGFIIGRSVSEHIFELERAFVEFSCVSRGAALLLLDVQAVCPSLDRRFVFYVLGRLRVPITLCNAVEALYREHQTAIVLAGEEVATSSGIKQGCPFPGRLFAIDLDPLITQTRVYSYPCAARKSASGCICSV